ncbi:Hypothetical protein UVM_LOCUS365, partial [uncultured virus]
VSLTRSSSSEFVGFRGIARGLVTTAAVLAASIAVVPLLRWLFLLVLPLLLVLLLLPTAALLLELDGTDRASRRCRLLVDSRSSQK